MQQFGRGTDMIPLIDRPGASDKEMGYKHQPLAVVEQEAESVDSVAIHQHQHRSRSLFDRLSAWGLFVLIAGLAAEIVVVVLLSLIWQYGHNPSDQFRLPQAIASRNLTKPVVTLSALVARLAIAFHAAICTSLLAAILLEGKGVPFPEVIRFAAIRSLNGGPSTIILPMRHRVLFYLTSLPAITAMLLFFTTTASQFASTVLITDFGTAHYNETYASRWPLGRAEDVSGDDQIWQFAINYIGSRPDKFTPFGEQRSPSWTFDDAFDAGKRFHGFLPTVSYSNEGEVQLTKFKILATMFASRIACVRPKLSARLQAGAGAYLVGNVTYAKSDANFLHCDPNAEGSVCDIPFNCTLPYPKSSYEIDNDNYKIEHTSEWVLALCAVAEMSSWEFGQKMIEYPENQTASYGSSLDMIMVLNLTSSMFVEELGGVSLSTQPRSTGEWNTYDLGNSTMLDVSLCFADTDSKFEYAQLTKQSVDKIDLSIAWNTSLGKYGGYDTTNIQKFLGVTNEIIPASERGVFSMDFMDVRNASAVQNISVLDFRGSINKGMFKYMEVQKPSTFIPMCTWCVSQTDGLVTLHPFMSTLFQDVIKATRHPAYALQALYSGVAQSIYYEQLPSLKEVYKGDITLRVAIELPTSKKGFWAFIAMLGAHNIIVGIVVWLFATRTRYTLIGEVWQNVGQGVVGLPEQVLKDKVGSTDDEIYKSCKATGYDRTIVGLSISESTGIVEVTQRSRHGG